MVPAAAYADDTEEVTVGGYTWMQTVLEPELSETMGSPESTKSLLMTQASRLSTQFLVSIDNGTHSLKRKGKKE